MPSSTSSSDVPYRDTPEKNWGLAWAIAIVLVVAGVALWEMQARAMHHVPGDYDELTNFAIQWGEERLELDDPNNDSETADEISNIAQRIKRLGFRDSHCVVRICLERIRGLDSPLVTVSRSPLTSWLGPMHWRSN